MLEVDVVMSVDRAAREDLDIFGVLILSLADLQCCNRVVSSVPRRAMRVDPLYASCIFACQTTMTGTVTTLRQGLLSHPSPFLWIYC